jgi:hypothetical protein
MPEDRCEGIMTYDLHGLVHHDTALTFVPGTTKDTNPVANRIFRYLYDPYTIVHESILNGGDCYVIAKSYQRYTCGSLLYLIEKVIQEKEAGVMPTDLLSHTEKILSNSSVRRLDKESISILRDMEKYIPVTGIAFDINHPIGFKRDVTFTSSLRATASTIFRDDSPFAENTLDISMPPYMYLCLT